MTEPDGRLDAAIMARLVPVISAGLEAQSASMLDQFDAALRDGDVQIDADLTIVVSISGKPLVGIPIAEIDPTGEIRGELFAPAPSETCDAFVMISGQAFTALRGPHADDPAHLRAALEAIVLEVDRFYKPGVK